MKVRSEGQIDKWDPKRKVHFVGYYVELLDGRRGEWMEYMDQREKSQLTRSKMKACMWRYRRMAVKTAHSQQLPGGIARERAVRQEEEGKEKPCSGC